MANPNPPINPAEIEEDVWVFTSKMYDTTSTVIRTPGEIVVIDPNWLPEEVYHIRHFINTIIENRRTVLLFTHSDYDHIIGYGAFTPDLVIASEVFSTKNNKEDDMRDAIQSDIDLGVIRGYPLTYPNVDTVIGRDGVMVSLTGVQLICYLAPGHTPESIFTIVEPAGILIAGDYFSDVEFPLVQDMQAYRSTLGKLGTLIEKHSINTLIPGHGTVAHGQHEMIERQLQAIEYLDDMESALTGSDFPEHRYRRRYPNWDELRPWHDENIQKLQALNDSH